MKEIGSEFWADSQELSNKLYKVANNEAVLLAGRTAIDFIIRDIQSANNFTKVLLPSYCCESMIEPFLINSVFPIFYHPFALDDLLKKVDEVEAVLLMDYFGFKNDFLVSVAEQIHKDKIVIYDSTHCVYENYEIEKFIDYSFISYRKWTYCNFATVKIFNNIF